MGDGNVQLGGAQGGGQGGVGVAVDHHHGGFFPEQDLFNAREHIGGLAGMGARADAQVEVRFGQLQGRKLPGRHVMVIVLAGMQHLEGDVAAVHGPGDRCKFYELGPGPDNM